MKAMVDLPDTMTAQDLLDLNIQHFLRDQQPYSFDDRAKACKYRARTGVGCALGIAMTDEEARQADDRFDQETATGLYEVGLLPERLAEIDIEFMEDVQFAHDMVAGRREPDQDKRRLQAHRLWVAADAYGLDWPEDMEVSREGND